MYFWSLLQSIEMVSKHVPTLCLCVHACMSARAWERDIELCLPVHILKFTALFSTFSPSSLARYHGYTTVQTNYIFLSSITDNIIAGRQSKPVSVFNLYITVLENRLLLTTTVHACFSQGKNSTNKQNKCAPGYMHVSWLSWPTHLRVTHGNPVRPLTHYCFKTGP